MNNEPIKSQLECGRRRKGLGQMLHRRARAAVAIYNRGWILSAVAVLLLLPSLCFCQSTLSQTPQVNSGGVVNAASFIPGPVSPGSIISIFGKNLATSMQGASSLPLPTNINGTQVNIDGIATPLFYVSPTQINLQVPWEAATGTLTVQVTVNGVGSNFVTVAAAQTAPWIFATNAVGTGQGAIVSAFGTVAGTLGSAPGARPVNPGDFVSIFAMGLGPVSNQPPSGAAGPNNPLAYTTGVPTVMIGGRPATVAFSGLAPGFAGLYQLNVQVPQGVPVGSAVPVAINAGGVQSNAVAIAIGSVPPPVQIVSTSPQRNQAGVSVTTGVEIDFSGPLDPATVGSQTFKLLQGNIEVPATITYDPAANRVLFAPSTALATNTTYTVSVVAQAPSQQGTEVGAGDAFWFTTMGPPSLAGSVVPPPTVNASSLTVLSLGNETQPAADGTFQTPVKTLGVTLVAAMFPGKPFGLMALTIPQAQTSSASPVSAAVVGRSPAASIQSRSPIRVYSRRWQITASSQAASSPADVTVDFQTTAESLIFLTPYFSNSNISNAQVIMAAVASDPHTAVLAAVLATAWSEANPLNDPGVQSAIQAAVVSVWATLAGVTSGVPPGQTAAPNSAEEFRSRTATTSAALSASSDSVQPPMAVTPNCKHGLSQATETGQLPCLDLDFLTLQETSYVNGNFDVSPANCSGAVILGCATYWLARVAPITANLPSGGVDSIVAGEGSNGQPDSPVGPFAPNCTSLLNQSACTAFVVVPGQSSLQDLDVVSDVGMILSDALTKLNILPGGAVSQGDFLLPGGPPQSYVARFYSGGFADQTELSNVFNNKYTNGRTLWATAFAENALLTAVEVIEAPGILPSSLLSCTVQKVISAGTMTDVVNQVLTSDLSTGALFQTAFQTAANHVIDAIVGAAGPCAEDTALQDVLETLGNAGEWLTGVGTAIQIDQAIANGGLAAQRIVELRTQASPLETAIITVGATTPSSPQVASLRILCPSATMFVGQQQTCTVVATDAGDNLIPASEVLGLSWNWFSVSGATVVNGSASAPGASSVQVTAVGVGAATLSAATASSYASFALTVNAPTVASISVNPNPVGGGSSATLNVTLTGPAPSEGAKIILSASNSGLSVQPSFTIPEGQTVGSIQGLGSSSITSLTITTVTASYNNSNRSASITVTPLVVSETIASVLITPSTITSGVTATVTVNLSGPAASGGISVNLSSSNSSAFPVPSPLNIMAGQSSSVAQVKAGLVSVATTVAVSASYNNSSQSGTVTVNSAASALSITTASLNPATATVGTGYAAQQAVAATGGTMPYTWSATGLPNGMSINSSTGAVFGTPTVSGTFSLTVTVQDSSSPKQTASKGLSITVNPAAAGDFSISASPSSATTTQGFTASYTATIQSLNGFSGTVSLFGIGLPSGYNASATSWSPGSVTLSSGGSATATFNLGTNTSTVTGTSSFILRGTSGSLSHDANVSVTVNSAASALSITTASLNPATATVGTGYAAQQAVAATGGTTPYTWSATGLPNGMSINSSTGAVFGTPTVSGTFSLTVTVQDSSSPKQTASKGLSITVNPAAAGDFSISASPSSATTTQGFTASYTATIQSLNGFSGTVSLFGIGLPSGYNASATSWSPGSVTLSSGGSATATFNLGTNTSTVTGTSSFILRGTSGSLSHDANVSVTVNSAASALSITTASLNPATATVGTGYAAQQAVAATGGTTPYTWSATGLPNGMSINSSTGAVFGTPTVSGTFSLTVTVQDSSSPKQTASKGLSITVNPAAAGDFSISASPSSATTTQGFTASYTATIQSLNGFSGTVSLFGIGLPSGYNASATSWSPGSVTLSSGGSATATFNLGTNTSTVTGTSSFILRGTSGSLSHDANVSVTVNSAASALSITTASLNPATATVGTGYAAQQAVAATGGTTPYTWSATGLPNGMSINSSTGAVFGTPTVSGTFSLTVTVQDSSSPKQTASKGLSITVNPAAAGDFSISASPSSATTTQGFTASYTATIQSLNGFSGTVSLFGIGLPSGYNASATSWSPGSVTLSSGGSATATFNLGTNTSTVTGTSSFILRGTSGSLSHDANVSVTVNSAASALSITTASLNPATATVGTGYAAQQAVAATGGTTPYTWSATGLPNGMSINSSTGAVFGTPTVSGTFSLTVTVQDSSSPKQTASKGLSITVNPAAQAPTVSTSPAGVITVNSATLYGTVNPNGLTTTYWYLYGTSSSLSGAAQTGDYNMGSGTSTASISANIGSLARNTTYYFQLQASNSGGTSKGSILNFKTAP